MAMVASWLSSAVVPGALPAHGDEPFSRPLSRVGGGADRDRLLGILAAARLEIAAHQDQTARQIPLVIVHYQQ
jgi:hypothetical protein